MCVPNVHVFVHALIWDAGTFLDYAGAQRHSPKPHYLVVSVRYIFLTPAVSAIFGRCSADLSSTIQSLQTGLVSGFEEIDAISVAWRD
jgi:hypothetical protein